MGKSTFTVLTSNPTLGQSFGIRISSDSDDNLHQLYADNLENSYIDQQSGGGEMWFVPPLEWASKSPYKNTVDIILDLATRYAGKVIGYYDKTVSFKIPDNVAPTCSLEISDASGYESTYGSYIKGSSKIKVNVNTVNAYDSPIVSYKIEVNGSTYTENPALIDTSNLLGEVEIKATVTDGRGKTGTATRKVTVIEKAIPYIRKLTVHRCDAEGNEDIKGEYCLATFSAEVLHVLAGTNANYYLHYKKMSDTDYAEIAFSELSNVYSVTDKTHIFPADSGSTYDVYLSVVLDDDTTSEVHTTLSTAFALMHFHKSGTSLGLGCVAENEETLDVDLFGRFRREAAFEDDVTVNGVFKFSNYLRNMQKLGSVWGKILDSEDGTIKGVGHATICIDITGAIRIDFSVKIITSGTVKTTNYGINWDYIKSKCDWIPDKTVKVFSTGTWMCVNADKTVQNYDDNMGYYMSAKNNRWAFGVVSYDSNADTTSRSTFYESSFLAGELLTGTCYAYISEY